MKTEEKVLSIEEQLAEIKSASALKMEYKGRPYVAKIREFDFGDRVLKSAEIRQKVQVMGVIDDPEILRKKSSSFESERELVTFTPVEEDDTVESVQEWLDSMGKIYIKEKVSNRPILNSYLKQSIAMSTDKVERYNEIAEKQLKRYPENHPCAGKIYVGSGEPSYVERILAKEGGVETINHPTYYLPDYMASEWEESVACVAMNNTNNTSTPTIDSDEVTK